MLKFIKEYFNLSNTEQKGIIGLLLIILFIFVGTRIFFMFQPAGEIPQNNTALLAQFYEDSINYDNSNETTNISSNVISKKEIKYFNFNPNTATKKELELLGFDSKTANILINFRNKGGKFYKKEDLKKVYGVSEELYLNVEAYIIIPQKEFPKKEYIYQDEKKIEKIISDDDALYKKENSTPIIVNINTADSITLTNIKGIGATYASRIIKYRNLLGGFNSTEQLKEVYGINNEVYAGLENQIKVAGTVKQINVNTASWAELKNHPYINSNMANIITKYVKSNGKVSNLDKILNPSIFDEQTIQKIKPYLKAE